MPQITKQEQLPGDGGSKASGELGSGHGKKRLLLIEDEPSARLVLLNKLRLAGLEVEVAANGHVALEKLSSGGFDAIFMDLLLPDVKGVNVIKAARDNPRFASRPIYVCTSAALMDTWTRRGTKAGATKVFDKAATPIDQIVREVAADLTGSGAEFPGPADKSKPDPNPTLPAEAPTSGKSSQTEMGESAGKRPPIQSSDQPPSLMKRLFGTFGRANTRSAPSPSSSATEPPTAPATNAPASASETTHASEPRVQADPNASVSKPEEQVEKTPASPVDAAADVSTHRGVAVLTLDDVGGILSADEACVHMFGWKGLELIGQNVMVLLKDGLNNELGRFLQRLKSADHSNPACGFRVIARKKDGSEFQASVTPLRWSSDTTISRKADGARFTWTAVFRDLACEAASTTHGAQDQSQGIQISAAPPTPWSAAAPQGQESKPRQHDVAGSADPTSSGTAFATNQEHELELNRVRTALERANEERRQLEPKLQELAASKTDLEKRLEAQNLMREELLKSSNQVSEQLNNARTAAERAEAAQHQEAARSTRLEEELANLRRAHQEIDGKLSAEQQAAAELRRRTADLEQQLQQNAGNLEFVKADAGTHAAEQARLASELRAQLEAAKVATDRAEAALKEEVARNQNFEERLRLLSESLKAEQSERAKRFDLEVTGLWQAHEELQDRLATEQKVATDSARRTEELESQLSDRSAEVERVKAALEQQTAEQERLESHWREQLETTEALAKTLEAALVEAEQVNKRSEEELVGLRREREELSVKLMSEQQAVAESRRRLEDLEVRLRENAAELERVNAELKKSGRGKGFETELTSLHQMRDMLSCKLAAEQRSNDDSKRRSDELENRLRENSVELERVKADADKQAEEQARLEAELQAKLNEARTAAEQAETALREKAARCCEFENDLVTLRHDRDGLHAQLEAEQQVAAVSKRRNEELEDQLRQNAGELKQVKAAADKYAEEHGRLETELRGQLESAKAATARAEAARDAEATRNKQFDEQLRVLGNELRMEQSEITKRLEKELAETKRARGELHDKLAQEKKAAEAAKRGKLELEGRLRDKSEELERLTASLNKQTADHRGVEQELREQLKAAKSAAGKAETTRAEESQRSIRMEKELAGLRQTRDELTGRLNAEQQGTAKSKRRIKELEKKLRDSTGSLERTEAELRKRSTSGSAAESDLREQLATAKAAAAQAEERLTQKDPQFNQLERELAGLREEREALYAKFVEEQQGGAKSKRRVKELEKQLRDSATGFARFKVEMEKRAAELGRRDSDVNAVKDAAEQAEAARQEASARSAQLAEELESLRQLHDELSARFSTERQATAASNRRIEELENRLRESAAELGRTKAVLENQVAEQSRRNSDQPGATGDAAELAEELCHLRENEAARAAELSEVERRVRESVASLARVTADLERERGERRRVEQRSASLAAQLQQLHEELGQHLESEKTTQQRIGHLEQHLHESEGKLARVSAEWQKEAADRQLAEEQLKSFGDMSAQLRKYLSLFEESKKVFKRTQDDLETRLQASVKALSENESRFQREAAERQRLEEALAVAQRSVQDQSERSALEMAKLRTDLQMEQLERKRMEGDALQSRYASLDSNRVGRAMANSLRRQVRQPVDELVQSTRRLLEIELAGEQKKLVESVLENALLVQTNLQETGGSSSDKESGTMQP